MSSTLIFGGARSGKSAYAERLAQSADASSTVIYVATAINDAASDEEMQARIAHHRQRRPAHWQTVEQPYALGELLLAHNQPDKLILIDCLTVWLSNCLFAGGTPFPDIGTIVPPPVFAQQRTALLQALPLMQAKVILVSNEVGMGIVPMGAVSRWFVDEAGRLNQALAALADQVVWVAAGLPLQLKGQSC